MPRQDRNDLDAIILTGGASRRMGADKAEQFWGGRRAVDRVADLALEAGAVRIITAGPRALGYAHVADPEPFGGPVAGVLSGLAALGPEAVRVLVLAVDAPSLRLSDLMGLIEAGGVGAAYAGFPLPMVIKATGCPNEAEAGWPLRRLVDRAGLAQITPDPDALDRLRGANTPQDYARLARSAGWTN